MSDIKGRDDEGSYRIEVIADSSGKWCGNGVRLDTQENAVAYAKDLYSRWTAVREWRIMRKGVDEDFGSIDEEVARG